MTNLNWADCLNLAGVAQEKIGRHRCKLWGVPRGGIPAALLIAQHGDHQLVSTPEEADVIVDDLIDSGRTRAKYRKQFPKKLFAVLLDKQDGDYGWVVFPWEQSKESDAEELVVRLLQHFGEDPNREGLIDTPKRYVKAAGEIFGGYKLNPKDVLATCFAADGYDEMVVLRGIEFYSTCEHHLQPFTGHVDVAYIPKKKVVGLSKLARLVDVFAKRLQIQERMTVQIADAIDEHLQPRGVGVVVEARHFCMLCRGVRKQNSVMVTSSLKGLFRQPAVRSEFLTLAKR